MKKYLFLILALLLVGQAYAATPGNKLSPGVGDILGAGKFDSDAHKVFRLVRFVPASGTGDSTTLTADSIVIWDTTSDDGVTITTSVLSGDAAVAGVVVQAALTPDTLGNTAVQDAGKRNWTWLQTYGQCNVNWQAQGGVAANNIFGTSTSKGCANSFALTTTAGAAGNGVAGFAYDAVSASTDSADGQVFLRLN